MTARHPGMIILGLTGSIAMGKSTAAAMLADMGLPIFDADATVHGLLGPGGRAVPAVKAAFPDALTAGPDGREAIDRGALGRIVFADRAALVRLESILHPLVREAEGRFLARAARRRARLAVLDIPLLFETGGEARCDAVILVTAPRFLQAARALRRPGMTTARLESIRARQMPEAEKCRRADFVVRTGRSRGLTRRQLARIVGTVSRWRRGKACARSSWIRKPPASIRRTGTESSKSVASS